jgi:hypothetical protein
VWQLGPPGTADSKASAGTPLLDYKRGARRPREEAGNIMLRNNSYTPKELILNCSAPCMSAATSLAATRRGKKKSVHLLYILTISSQFIPFKKP